MRKLLTLAIFFILLMTSAIAVTQDIRISTRGYEKQIISMDGNQQEANIKINLKYRETCQDCKFQNYGNNGRIRFYWFNDIRNSVELKKIKATNIEFGSEIIKISGVVDTMVLYNERYGRSIRRNEPVEITLNKLTNEMQLKLLGSTIDDIIVRWR